MGSTQSVPEGKQLYRHNAGETPNARHLEDQLDLRRPKEVAVESGFFFFDAKSDQISGDQKWRLGIPKGWRRRNRI